MDEQSNMSKQPKKDAKNFSTIFTLIVSSLTLIVAVVSLIFSWCSLNGVEVTIREYEENQARIINELEKMTDIKRDFTYTVSNNGIVITKYKGLSEIVEIPDTIENIHVVGIETQAFAWRKNIISVVIPDTVVSIGEQAFFGCFSLVDITFPGSLQTIGDKAFDQCVSLEKIKMYNAVISIGDKAFYNCNQLTSVVLSSSLNSIGEFAFFNCSSLQKIIIPASVQTVKSDAFKNCSSLAIYCRESEDNVSWHKNWNYSNCDVNWRYSGN